MLPPRPVPLKADLVPSLFTAGHEIVATLAQVHLTPKTEEAVRGILPAATGGHLASIAAWADTVRSPATCVRPSFYTLAG